MRRSMILPMAALLVLGVAAPVSAGANVSNTSGGGNSVYGEWFGEGTYGYAYLWQENGQPGYGEIYQESGEWVLCPAPKPAPETTAIGPTDTGGGEEFYGFQGTRTFGWAYDVRISLSREPGAPTPGDPDIRHSPWHWVSSCDTARASRGDPRSWPIAVMRGRAWACIRRDPERPRTAG